MGGNQLSFFDGSLKGQREALYKIYSKWNPKNSPPSNYSAPGYLKKSFKGELKKN
jgi:hypothetical protein